MTSGGKLIGILLLVAALTACGGGSKDSGSKNDSTTTKPSTSSTSATTSTTTAPTADPVVDEALARSLVLVQEDFPAGWKGSTPAPDDADDEALDKEMASCVGGVDPSKASAEVEGEDFDLGDAEVSTSVSISATRADFEQDLAALKSAKYITCTKQIAGREIGEQLSEDAPGATIDDMTIERFSTPQFGEVTVGLRVTMTVTNEGETIRFYIDSVAYGEGRTEATVTFFSIGAPFDPALESSLLAKAGAKLKVAV